MPAEETIDNYAFSDESLNLLYAAIRKLSEIDRAVIMLYLEEKSYDEIAEITGISVSNVGTRRKIIPGNSGYYRNKPKQYWRTCSKN